MWVGMVCACKFLAPSMGWGGAMLYVTVFSIFVGVLLALVCWIE